MNNESCVIQEASAKYRLAADNERLPKGYKLAEVGVIPADWSDIKLGCFISLQRGHDLTAHERRQGNVPVMGSAGQNGFHDTALVKAPGLVIGRSGASFGQSHYCDRDFWPHNTALFVTDFHGNDPLFSFYFLKALDFTRHNSGGAQQSLNRNFIYPIPVAIPPFPEQRAIAAALSDADALLAKLDQLIAKKRDLKQASMQQLLTGQRRLPGFSGEWSVKRLGELFDVVAGGDYDPFCSNPFQDEHHLFPIYSNSISGTGLYGFCSYATYPRNSITVTARGTLGVANFRDHPYTAIGRVIVLQPKQKLESRFFSEFINNRVNFVVESTGVPQLTVPQISMYELLIPDMDEQTAIAAILSDMDAEIAVLEARRDKTRALKQGMMQELLTGRIRLV